MKINRHLISISKTAKYVTAGILDEKTESVWFLLHGYGQLAEEFIKKFELLFNERNFTIVPEALNRFYLKSFSGKVGATWMTTEDRQNEINDYVNYLEKIYSEEIPQALNSKIKVNLLGFSQGTHTAARWILNSGYKFNNLILWGGSLQKNDELIEKLEILKKLDLYLVIGKQDQFIDEKSIETEKNRLGKLGLNYNLILFDGKHEIEENALSELIDLIQNN
ncbi:phospholipase/Carboxylesterase [bacterium BMS3Abin04]|nr:phospholipase/Carboxylesterase [bacterium BMS3Abin04]